RHTRFSRDWSSDVCSSDLGDDLLLHGLGHTTIGAAAFHFRVRDGIGWFHSAMVARERVEGREYQILEGCGPRRPLVGWEVANIRSEERRVGKEGRSRRARH